MVTVPQPLYLGDDVTEMWPRKGRSQSRQANSIPPPPQLPATCASPGAGTTWGSRRALASVATLTPLRQGRSSEQRSPRRPAECGKKPGQGSVSPGTPHPPEQLQGESIASPFPTVPAPGADHRHGPGHSTQTPSRPRRKECDLVCSSLSPKRPPSPRPAFQLRQGRAAGGSLYTHRR